MFWNAITYEISLTRQEFKRQVYGIMDFLRDIGGLFGALGPIFGVFVAMFQYRGIYMSLSTTMMSAEAPPVKGGAGANDGRPRRKGEEEEATPQSLQTQKLRNIHWHCGRVTFLNLQFRCSQAFLRVFSCCQPDTKSRILIKNYRKFEKEIQVTHILKQLRVLKAVAKKNLTKAQWRQVKANSCKINSEILDEEKEKQSSEKENPNFERDFQSYDQQMFEEYRVRRSSRV